MNIQYKKLSETTKPDEIKYSEWLKKEFNVNEADLNSKRYESVILNAYSQFEKSSFWKNISKNLIDMNDSYKKTKKYILISDQYFNPELVRKPFDSFINKTYRKNIVYNKNWPKNPKQGWYIPLNWYSRINDLLRTLIVVKYLDGINFFLENFIKIAKEAKLKFSYDFEAKEEGYYALHCYLIFPCEIPDISWSTEFVNFKIEIQITTQLQENIRILLHNYYDNRRSLPHPADLKWQWDYKNPEFATNYLGHILHYLEGMIIQIRDKEKT